MTLVLASLFVVMAPLAVIGALVGAGINFSSGAIGSGVWMLVVAAVLAVFLLLPAFFLWSRFLRKNKPMNLMINGSGFTLLEGEDVLRSLPWERVTSVQLAKAKAKAKTERLVVSSARSNDTATSPARSVQTWMNLPLSKMDGDRSALVDALARHSRGRYKAGQ
jgi:thiol:disulfide interchange protein